MKGTKKGKPQTADWKFFLLVIAVAVAVSGIIFYIFALRPETQAVNRRIPQYSQLLRRQSRYLKHSLRRDFRIVTSWRLTTLRRKFPMSWPNSLAIATATAGHR